MNLENDVNSLLPLYVKYSTITIKRLVRYFTKRVMIELMVEWRKYEISFGNRNSKKWNISERSVRNYCAHGRVQGAFLTRKDLEYS